MDAASLVSAWDVLVLQLTATFTSPTAQVWRQVALGWVLHHSQPGDCDKRHPFRTRQQWAAQMVQNAVKTLPNVHWRVVADGQYATRQMVESLPEGMNLVSRIRVNVS